MAVRVQIQASNELEALESLADWLRGEPELAGRVRFAVPEPQEGEMGALTDALVVAVGSGGAITVLATSLKTWLAHPRRSDIRVVLRSGKNQTVEIDAKRTTADDVERVVRALMKTRDPE